MRAWAHPPGREVPKVRLAHAALQGNREIPAELGVRARRIAQPPAGTGEPRLVPVGQRVPAREGAHDVAGIARRRDGRQRQLDVERGRRATPRPRSRRRAPASSPARRSRRCRCARRPRAGRRRAAGRPPGLPRERSRSGSRAARRGSRSSARRAGTPGGSRDRAGRTRRRAARSSPAAALRSGAPPPPPRACSARSPRSGGAGRPRVPADRATMPAHPPPAWRRRRSAAAGAPPRATAPASRFAVGTTLPFRNCASVRRFVTPARWKTCVTSSHAADSRTERSSSRSTVQRATRGSGGAAAAPARERTRTVAPRAISASTRCEPMNPDDPVTRAIMNESASADVARRRSQQGGGRLRRAPSHAALFTRSRGVRLPGARALSSGG